MNFSNALNGLKAGHRMTREGWNGVGLFVELQRPDEHSKMSEPYACLNHPDGRRVPWVPTQTDMLADDWMEA